MKVNLRFEDEHVVLEAGGDPRQIECALKRDADGSVDSENIIAAIGGLLRMVARK